MSYRKGRSLTKSALLAGAMAWAAAEATAQAPAERTDRPEARRISISWVEAPIRDVLMAFSAASGRSIVAGAGVQGFVTADINDRPWDAALRAILGSRGLVAVEDEYGIIRVDAMQTVLDDEAIAPIVTRAYRIAYVDAEEIRAAIAPLLTERGSVSVSPSTNTVVVSDVERVHRVVGGVIGRH